MLFPACCTYFVSTVSLLLNRQRLIITADVHMASILVRVKLVIKYQRMENQSFSLFFIISPALLKVEKELFLKKKKKKIS